MRDARAPVEAAYRRLAEEKTNSADREWTGWLTRLRESPILKSRMTRFLGLFLGVPMSVASADVGDKPEREPTAVIQPVYDADAESIPMEEIVGEPKGDLTVDLPEFFRHRPIPQVAPLAPSDMPELMADYERNLDLIAENIEGGNAAPEYYARVGLPEWTTYQRSLFSTEPVQERFFDLHPEFRDQRAGAFLELFPEMLNVARTEFRFSNQFRFLIQDATDLYVANVAGMPPEKALSVYKQMMLSLSDVGLKELSVLNEGIASVLPDDHPVRVFIADSGYETIKPLLGPSRTNVVLMDQASGELRVFRPVGNDFVLLDTFPAIGGALNTPEMSAVGKPAGSEYVHVPDTVLTVAYVDRAKTSWSWNNSWVPQGAPIREQGEELQYQHPSTKQWYDLTGPNAAFFPDRDGKTIKPFDGHLEPMDTALIRAATHGDPASGGTFVPHAWTKAEIVGRVNGAEVPTTWEWNDFGSMAMRLSLNGVQTNINIHSKPGEDMNDFLGVRTHGCFTTYGAYVKELADGYGVGSGTKIVVTTERSYDLGDLLVAQK
ncbi:hypothetical protein EBS80_01800 [bacterium]|nr:hypothetical protein [bacterium]